LQAPFSLSAEKSQKIPGIVFNFSVDKQPDDPYKIFAHQRGKNHKAHNFNHMAT
jgi:hypothetical protein